MQPLTIDSVVTLRRPGTEELLLTQPSSVGRALMPSSPTHLSATRNGDGSISLHWTRRSRDGWYWRDGIDVPLDEPSELYRVIMTPDTGSARSVEVAMPSFSVLASDLTNWRAGGAQLLTISICQVGRHALSPPATLTFTL